MEYFAQAFDCPIDSPEHQVLADEVWLVGVPATVRFFLGRLIHQNLFRQSDSEVEEHLVAYISETTSLEGGNLVRDLQGWQIADEILRYRFEMQTKRKSALKARHIAAIEAFLTNPTLTLQELANELKTTEKQLARIPGLTLARRQARFTHDR